MSQPGIRATRILTNRQNQRKIFIMLHQNVESSSIENVESMFLSLVKVKQKCHHTWWFNLGAIFSQLTNRDKISLDSWVLISLRHFFDIKNFGDFEHMFIGDFNMFLGTNPWCKTSQKS